MSACAGVLQKRNTGWSGRALSLAATLSGLSTVEITNSCVVGWVHAGLKTHQEVCVPIWQLLGLLWGSCRLKILACECGPSLRA